MKTVTKSQKGTKMAQTEAVKAAAKHAGDTELLEIKDDAGHRTKIPIRNTLYRLTRPIDQWSEPLARKYWCLAVAMGGGAPADFYPWMVKQTVIDKLKEFYKLKGKQNRPVDSRNEVYAAVEELQKAGLIEESVFERYLDTRRIRGWKPGANDVVVTVEDEFKVPARKYM